MANFIEAANRKALEIMQNAQPTLVGMGVAKDVVPGMHKKLVMRRSSHHVGEDVWAAPRCRNRRTDL